MIWGGECLYNDDTAHDYQYFYIYGTGPDPENFTVIMDFWREDAFAQNFICLYPDERQDMPGAGVCDLNDNRGTCLGAADLVGGRDPDGEVERTRGAGCSNDGGPLWISIQLQDNEEGISGPSGGGDVPR